MGFGAGFVLVLVALIEVNDVSVLSDLSVFLVIVGISTLGGLLLGSLLGRDTDWHQKMKKMGPEDRIKIDDHGYADDMRMMRGMGEYQRDAYKSPASERISG